MYQVYRKFYFCVCVSLYHLYMVFFYDTNHQDPGIHHDLIEERAKGNSIRTTDWFDLWMNLSNWFYIVPPLASQAVYIGRGNDPIRTVPSLLGTTRLHDSIRPDLACSNKSSYSAFGLSKPSLLRSNCNSGISCESTPLIKLARMSFPYGRWYCFSIASCRHSPAWPSSQHFFWHSVLQ